MTRRLVVATFLACSMVAHAQEPPRLLTPGTWAELPPNPEGPWFVLVKNRGRYLLRRAPLRVRTITSPCEPFWKQTLPEVSVAGKALFLFRGLPFLREGPLASGTEVGFLFPGQSHVVALSSTDHWGIQAYGQVERDDTGRVLRNYRLALQKGRYESVFFTADDLDEDPHVVWAGDLDRDARPDLIMHVILATRGAKYVLFLSSAAQDGEMVHPVASFIDPSC